MQDLIEDIVTAAGLNSAAAERGLCIMLGLLKSHGNQMKVDELLAKLPGAAELAGQYGSAEAGRLGGGPMGGPLAAIAKLSAAGRDLLEALACARVAAMKWFQGCDD